MDQVGSVGVGFAFDVLSLVGLLARGVAMFAIAYGAARLAIRHERRTG